MRVGNCDKEGVTRMKEPGSNKEWKKWGETDPLFAVASWASKSEGGYKPMDG